MASPERYGYGAPLGEANEVDKSSQSPWPAGEANSNLTGEDKLKAGQEFRNLAIGTLYRFVSEVDCFDHTPVMSNMVHNMLSLDVPSDDGRAIGVGVYAHQVDGKAAEYSILVETGGGSEDRSNSWYISRDGGEVLRRDLVEKKATSGPQAKRELVDRDGSRYYRDYKSSSKKREKEWSVVYQQPVGPEEIKKLAQLLALAESTRPAV